MAYNMTPKEIAAEWKEQYQAFREEGQLSETAAAAATNAIFAGAWSVITYKCTDGDNE